MSRPATTIVLSADEEKTLTMWTRAGTTEQRVAERARIVLAAARGDATTAIAHRLRARAATVSTRSEEHTS